jgi:hypothetical protein
MINQHVEEKRKDYADLLNSWGKKENELPSGSGNEKVSAIIDTMKKNMKKMLPILTAFVN